MLSLAKRMTEIKAKETEQMCNIKSTQKISKARSKPNLQKYSTKQNSEGNRSPYIESKADVNRRKNEKKTKTTNSKKINKTEKNSQNLQNTIFLGQLKKSLFNKVDPKESLSKELLPMKSCEENSAESTNNTIFVSLDFIEDCQIYKKKFMKSMCGQDIKTGRKSLGNISSYHKRYLNKTETTPSTNPTISEADHKTNKQIQRGKILLQNKVIQNFSPKNSEEKSVEYIALEESTTYKKEDADAKLTANEEPINDGLSSQCKKLDIETFSIKQPFNVKPSSEDISTVDKKYLELLFSIANCNETKKFHMKNNESKHIPNGVFVQAEKKKISGKTYFENKIKKEKLEEEKKRKLSEIQEQSLELNTPTALQEGTVFSRLVRDLTKSELQILPGKRNNQQNGRNSEIRSTKKTAYSKPDVNDNRKKRKTRNNVCKNDNDVIEMPFPREMSKVADVKELWRRGNRRKSENSLSSRSSSTVNEKEEILEFKNAGLESYKILKKIVEEEVKTICKKFIQEKIEKQNINLSEKENNQECDKDPTKLKKMCRDLRIIMAENVSDVFDTNANKTDEDNSRGLMNEEQKKFIPNNEEKKERNALFKYFNKHKTEDPNPNFLKEKKDLSSEVVKNWSIMHRLEKAFLALGTPTFPNYKIKDSSTLKTTNTKAVKRSADGTKYREESHQQNKTLSKNTNTSDKQEKKNPATVTTANSKRQKGPNETHIPKIPPIKSIYRSTRNARAENDTTQPSQKEKLQGTNNRRTGSQQGTESEDKSKQKKGKPQNQKSNLSEIKKSTARSLAKPKAFDFESHFSKRDGKPKKYKHNIASKNYISANIKPFREKEELNMKKPSNHVISNLNQNEEENLERKQTFDVIPLNDSSKIKPRKSKSCNKIDDSLDFDNTKKRFPPTRSADSKNLPLCNFSEVCQNPEDKIKTDITTPKTDVNDRIPAKCKPSQSQERPQTFSEKDCIRDNRETPLKVVKDRLSQDKKCEKAVPEEDLPPEILLRKEENAQERAVKKRSILSMRANQPDNPKMGQNFLQLQRKPVCNLAQEQSTPVENFPQEDTQSNKEILSEISSQGNPYDNLGFPHVSTSTFNVQDSSLQEDPSEASHKAVISNLNEFEILEQLSSLSTLSLCAMEQQQSTECADIKCLKRQPIWEQDIKQYRALVKEIMSQYKRIDGFLKQNEHSWSFPNDSACLVSKEDVTSDRLSLLSQNSQSVNIHEYRKKILLEYQALPIFEYKKKIQQEAGNNQLEEKRRNLSFVKPLKTEMDIDVKDYQPNIQKILDSQLYVDTENIFKRNEPDFKFNEKKSSLQEILPSKNEKTLKEEECLRSISTPKTFLSLTRAQIHLSSSAQNFRTVADSIKRNMGIEMQLQKI